MPLRAQSDVLADPASETLDDALASIGLTYRPGALDSDFGSGKFTGARFRVLSGTKLAVTCSDGDVVTFCSDVTSLA